VFRSPTALGGCDAGAGVVFKFVPIEGANLVNGWPQKGAADLLAEAVIARALTGLADGEEPDGVCAATSHCLATAATSYHSISSSSCVGGRREETNMPGILVRILMHELEHMCSQPSSLPLALLLQAWPLQAALLRLCEHMRSVLHAGRSLRPLCAPGTLGMSSAHQKTTLLTRCQTSSCMLCLRWATLGVI
jgi:hypothetical protein